MNETLMFSDNETPPPAPSSELLAPCSLLPPLPLRLGLLLNSPSAHQVDLLNALADRSDVDVFIGYAFPGNPDRPWGRPVPQRLPWELMPSGTMDCLKNRIGAWLDTQERDVWIITSNYTALRTHMAAWHLHRRGVCWAYMAEPPNPTVWWKRIVRRSIVRSLLKHTHGLASTGRQALVRYQGLYPAGIPTVSIPYYQSLDILLQLPLPEPAQPDEPIRFLNVSSLTPIKGLFCLLEACSQLPQNGWMLDIYGRGPLESRLNREIWRRQIPVRLCGTVPYEQRWKMYQGSHCFVFSTLGDGWGMALPEALAAGLPVISSDMAMSAHEFIRNGENGLIGPAGDPEFLATAMRTYVDQSEQLADASRRARDSVNHYRLEVGADGLLAFAHQLLASIIDCPMPSTV